MNALVALIRDHHARRTAQPLRAVLDVALAPAECGWRVVSVIRDLWWRRVAPVRLSRPAISIGGLAVGGSGKTEVASYVVAGLLERGRVPAVLTRGYGRRTSGTRVVGAGDLADAVGDEPLMLARRHRAAVVVVDGDRRRGSRTAEAKGADVFVLDDAFSHRRVARDVDVVVLSGADPWGGGRVMPRGPLREPLGALARAHVVWLHNVDRVGEAPGVRERLAVAAPRALLVESVFEPIALVAGRRDLPLSLLRGSKIVALSGIGDPGGLVHTLERLGAIVTRSFAFPDHHRFTDRDVARACDTAGRDKAMIVTTEKDAARTASIPEMIHVLRCRVKVTAGEEAFWDAAMGAVARR